MDEAVQRLLDEAAIRDVCTRYATALDTRDWELLRTCFTADAVAVYEGIGDCPGVDAITELCRRALEPLTRTQHLLGNFAADVHGDSADAQCYLQAQHVREDVSGGKNFIIAGRYLDELVRQDGSWRISRRRLETWWTDGNPDVVGRPG